jgi:hypothetical protein
MNDSLALISGDVRHHGIVTQPAGLACSLHPCKAMQGRPP